MKANLFKNFKSLKEKEEEIKLAEQKKTDNVSVNSVLESEIKTTIGTPEKEPVQKKRPVKKEIAEAKAQIKQQSENLQKEVSYSKKTEENTEKRTFTVFLKNTSLEFIKDLVFYKATAERQIFYNQSEAFIEALDEEKPFLKDINPRPDFIRDQEKNKKGGRKRNSDEVYDSTTTVYIPGSYYDFIKDVTYNKVISGNMYFKDWDLVENGIQKLKAKYGSKVKPRPDYIREEEMQRGRRTKANA